MNERLVNTPVKVRGKTFYVVSVTRSGRARVMNSPPSAPVSLSDGFFLPGFLLPEKDSRVVVKALINANPSLSNNS